MSQETCRKPVFDYKGKCESHSINLESLNLPKSTKTFLTPILEKVIPSKIDACLGDYYADDIRNLNMTETYKCKDIPLPEMGKYGVLAAHANNIPCGKPVTVSSCIMLDSCGTVVFIVNGGAATCAATYTTGVGALLSPLADSLDSIAVGYSQERRFTKIFTVAIFKDNSITTQEIRTRGHFFFGLNLGMPLDIKFAGKSLKDLIKVSSTTKVIVDFGQNDSPVQNFITTLSEGKPSRATINSIMDLGAEFTLGIDNKMMLKLETITKGLFRDMEIDVLHIDALVTQGGSNQSGLPKGVYIYLNSDVIKNLFSLFDQLCDYFGPILKEIGFEKISFPQTYSTLGLFINEEATGFDFQLPGLFAKCIFLFGPNEGSCQFGGKYFTAIYNGVEWIIKKAHKFFEDTSDVIVKFVNDVGNFCDNVTIAIKEKTQELAKKAEAADKARKEAERIAKDLANKAKDIFINPFKKWFTKR
jgi:hypothetical protein